MSQRNNRSRRQRPTVRFVACSVLGIAVLGCSRSDRKEQTTQSPTDAPNIQLISDTSIKLQLPRAANTLDLVDAPAIVITASDVYLTSLESTIPSKEQPISTTEAYARAARFNRVLHDRLVAKRENWAELHPNEPYPPVVMIAADGRVPVRAVTTAFYTAALAGFPNISFVVLGSQGTPKRLSLDALIPEHMVPSATRILLVAVQNDSVTLRWRESDGQVQPAERLNVSALSARIATIYAAEGKHKAPNDQEWDWVFIWAPDATMNQLAVAVDALSVVRRKFNFRGQEHNAPAFRIGFKMGKIPTNEELPTILPIDDSSALVQMRDEMAAFGFASP